MNAAIVARRISCPHHLKPCALRHPVLAGSSRNFFWPGLWRWGFAGPKRNRIWFSAKGQDLLNNRQAGRRRGRNNQRPQGNSSGRGQDNGNRVDNRARGNAPQLLEKYKTLARDSQMQGDRVMTEYYLQFADHYFRVTAEMRARFEESRPQRDDWQGDEGDDGGFDDQLGADQSKGSEDDNAERAYEAQRRQSQGNRDRQDRSAPRQERNDNRAERPERQERADGDFAPQRDGRDGGNRNQAPRNRDNSNRGAYAQDSGNRDSGIRENAADEDASQDAPRPAPRRERPSRNGAWRGNEGDQQADRGDSIDVNVLPPAFGSDGPISPMMDMDDGQDATAEAPATKRRGRPRKVVEEAQTAE